MPREPLRSRLRTIINRLAASLDAVEFEPHLTLFSGPSTDDEACAVTRRIAQQFAPIELIAERLGHTPSYTKTLFVQFRELAPARRMFEAAAKGYSRQSGYKLNPHLSLLYKTLPKARQQELCETLQAPMGSYGFDRLRMIETELPIEDAGPVRRWRVACDEPLAGS